MKLSVKGISALTLPAGKADHVFWDDELPGFGLRLRAGGSRSFIFQYKLGTKQRRMSLGTATKESFATLRNADGTIVKVGIRELASQLHARVRLGEDPASDKSQGRKRATETFKAVATRFLAFQKDRLRPESYRAAERHIGQYAKVLNEDSFTAIDRRRLAALIVDVKEKSGAVTANRLRSTLSNLFRWAMGSGLGPDSNPAIGIPAFAERTRERVLSDHELRLIWNATDPASHFGAIIRLLALTGQRADEIASLRWSEVEAEAIVLPSARTKNRRSHRIFLTAAAREILDAQPRRANGDGSLRELVFGVGQRGFSGWSASKRRLDATVAQQNGKPLPHWTTHDLRRSVATGMADLGVRHFHIEAVLNHVSGSKSGVAGIYNRSSYEVEKHRALEIWADHVLALAEGKQSNVTSLRRPA
jgi:integrase